MIYIFNLIIQILMNAIMLLFVIITVITLRALSTVIVILAICCYLIIGHVKVKFMTNS